MKHARLLLTALLVSLLAPVRAWAAEQAPNSGDATASRLEEYLGAPLFLPMQRLWEKRGGWAGILTATNGTVVAFQSPGGGSCRRSRDGGKTWDAEILIAADAINGRGLVNETTGDVLYVNPGAGWMFRSRDHGASWARERVQVPPDGFGNIPDAQIGVLAMQCGITLAHGKHRGRLIMPARVAGPKSSNAVEWRPYHYSTALYSDDGGDLWIGAYRSPDLPDGVRGTSYGCLGGMVRLPIPNHDILLYSNLDSDAGVMPAQIGGSTREHSEKITVWVSFDGGRSWPVKRLVHDGPSAYSTLAVGRPGTPSAGLIYLLFEGGPKQWDEAVQVAAFNLSWLLDGRDITTLTRNPLPSSTHADDEAD